MTAATRSAPTPEASVTPIGDYALLGDTRTAALVGPDGSIDWLCLPRFDGDPVFARLVAGPDGGHFAVGPADRAQVVARSYRRGSTVLETTWHMGSGRLTLIEGMISDVAGSPLPNLCLVRRMEARDAPVSVRLCLDPRFGVDRRRPRARRGRHLVCSAGAVALALTCDPEIDIRPATPIAIELSPGDSLTLVLSAAHRGPLTFVDPAAAWEALMADDARWRRWSASFEYDGPFAPALERSLITLRLLTYSPSGAPVAAPTTSLPEHLGGGRNWDYRYAWPRDASIGVGAFLGVGLEDRARAFLYWLMHASRLERPRLAPLLTIHGRHVPRERELGDWPGYADSRPVRFGNAAAGQHQLDNYGWVLDAMWLLVDAGHPLFRETWRAAMAMADLVARRWREPDAGIWEVRGEPAHYVHSKLMAWLTLDRALRIADTHRTPERRRRVWRTERDTIATDVVAHGYDEEQRTFVRAYGSRDVDASVLVLPLLGLERPDSPRVMGTIRAVQRRLGAGGPLLHRYRRGDDGLEGEEGAFLPCSFWLVQALAASGAVDEAVALFEELLDIGGALCLFAEEADPRTGEHLGNYPQALTHAALIQAALALRDATRGGGAGPARLRTPHGRPS